MDHPPQRFGFYTAAEVTRLTLHLRSQWMLPASRPDLCNLCSPWLPGLVAATSPGEIRGCPTPASELNSSRQQPDAIKPLGVAAIAVRDGSLRAWGHNVRDQRSPIRV